MITLVRLKATRDLLLPAMRGQVGAFNDPNLDIDIEIDDANRALIVKGFNRETKKDFGFALTEHSILDGTYIISFGPTLHRLLELLQES